MKYTLKNTLSLFEAVMEMYKGISKQKAKQLIGYSDFILNGEKISRNPTQILETGSKLEIVQQGKNRELNRIPDHRTPVIIYFEDRFLLIAIKPAGILSCGNRDQAINNSYHKVLENFLSDREQKKVRLWVIHRLDREVEGLIVFAKSEKIQQQLKAIWADVTKKYLALTENKPDPPKGIIQNWLKDTTQKVIASEKEIPGSRFAKTEYTYIKAEKTYHLIEVKLHTGRKNQIRVHLAGIHCPIVGDRKYGADASVVRQIRLAACELDFIHPATQKKVSVQYKPPKRFYRPSQDQDEKYRIL